MKKIQIYYKTHNIRYIKIFFYLKKNYLICIMK